jgi:hypothetical protein
MPVPTDINTLSTTPLANPPVGNVDSPSSLDDHMRQAYAFLAAVRTAGGVANVPAGSIAATNVQAAINELDAEKIGKSDSPVLFTAAGVRIQADFSNATLSQRGAFQSSVPNGATGILAIPNGSATTAAYLAGNGSDAQNAAYIGMSASSTEATITSFKSGAGAILPLRIYNQSAPALEINTSGYVSTPQGLFGIGTALGANSGYSAYSPSGAIELTTSANTAIIDLHSSTTWQDYNARIMCSGAGAGVGGGTMTYTAATHTFAAPAGSNATVNVGTGQIFASASGLTISTVPMGAMDLIVAAPVLRPTADNYMSIGTVAYRPTVIYAVSGTINTSDATQKTPVRGFTDEEIAAACALADETGFFQWLDAVEKKGADKAREHCGMTVQDAIAIMEAHSLEPFNYAFICYDEWDDQWQDVQINKGEDAEPIFEKQLVTPAGSRYSFRPDQLDRFIARGLHERQKQLEARIAALEAK